MGVSFKVAKTGTRYRPKLSHPIEISISDSAAFSHQKSAPPAPKEADIVGLGDDHVGYSTSLVNCDSERVLPEPDVSFFVILFPEGFAIGKPNEKGVLPHMLQDNQRLLHPYNRESKTLFSAIENGWLPGDIFDDLPCKYVNGTVTCEVHDYRNFVPKPGNPIPMGNRCPIVQKVCLRMCMENVVKDMPSISDDSWTYRDLLEVESRIIRALQPELYLDPDPSLKRLCKSPILDKLNLGIYARHKRSQRHVQQVNITAGNHLQKVSSNSFIEDFNPQLSIVPAASNCFLHSQNYDMGPEASRQSSLVECQMGFQLPANCSRSFPATAERSPNLVGGTKHIVTHSCNDSRNPDVALGKRDKCEEKTISLPMLKKPKQEIMDHECWQLTGNQVGSYLGTDLQRRGSQLELHFEAQNMQSGQLSGQKHTKVATNHFILSSQRNSVNHGCGKQLGMSDASASSHKRKPPQNRLVSAGLPSSPFVSSTEKATCNTCANSGNNGSPIRETQGPTKCKTKSLPKTPSTGEAGSPLNASNINAPLGGEGSSDFSQQKLPLLGFKGDPAVLNKFIMIDMVVKRYNLNNGSEKPDRCLDRKPLQHSPYQLMRHLSQDIKEFKDPVMPLSKSLVGGSTDIGKSRTLMFERSTHSFQGTGMHIIVRKAFCKLLLFKKPKDHKVEARVLYEDGDDSNPSGFSRLFPDTRYADLFAAQFASLMLRDGYQLTNDHMQPFQYCNSHPSDSITADHLSALTATGAVEIPCASSSCGQNLDLGIPVSNAFSSMNQELPSPSILSRTQTLFNANLTVSQLQLGYLAQHQMDSGCHARCLPLVTNNSTGSKNVLIGNQVVSNDSLLQLRLRQQCQRQHILHQHQGKMTVVGREPTIGMGSMSGGSTRSCGSLGMGSFCGGLSSPLSLSGLDQIADGSKISSFALNPQIRSGGIQQTQAVALAKMRLSQNRRGMISGGSIKCPMETIGETMVQAAATATALMCPPKLFTMNHILNQQQLRERQQCLQQQIGSPMQHLLASGLPDQMGSPVSYISCEQMSQQAPTSPQQLSLEVGAANCQQRSQYMTAGNVWLVPGSPQPSSQTHSSVGSITNSPTELQGVSRGGSVNNTSAGQ